MGISNNFFKGAKAKTYEDVRDSICSGDILLCSGSKPFSKLIQASTNSIWSHVAFVLRLDSIQRIMVLESVESIGVRTVPLSNDVRDYNGTGKGYPGKIAIARHKNFGPCAIPEKLRQMSTFAVDCFGYPYATGDIASIAARIGLGKLGLALSKQIQVGRAYICSEYAAKCYEALGITIPWNKKGFIAPADFAADPAIEGQFAIRVS